MAHIADAPSGARSRRQRAERGKQRLQEQQRLQGQEVAQDIPGNEAHPLERTPGSLPPGWRLSRQNPFAGLVSREPGAVVGPAHTLASAPPPSQRRLVTPHGGRGRTVPLVGPPPGSPKDVRTQTLQRSVPAVPPALCGTGWGERLWRTPDKARSAKLALYLCYWDLCEIGQELAEELWAGPPEAATIGQELATGMKRLPAAPALTPGPSPRGRGGKAKVRESTGAEAWALWCLSSGNSWLRERCDYRVDITDPGENDQALFRDLCRMADVLHLCEHRRFVWAPQLQPGQKVAIHHHGTGFRDNPYQWEREEAEAGYLRLVSTPDLLLCGERRDTLHWLPSPLPVAEFDRRFPVWQEREPGAPLQVLHGYTVSRAKGTEEFCRIVAEEQARGTKLEAGMYTGLQRRQSLWYISQCDAFFATFLYGPGMATLEAWAMRKPVLVGCSKEELAAQRECYGEELPFVYVTPETCGKALRDLAADEGLRREYGERGRRAVERLHDTPVVVKRLVELYEGAEPARRFVGD